MKQRKGISRAFRQSLAAMLAAALLIALLPAGVLAAPGDIYKYDQLNDKLYMANTGITERTEANNGSRKIAVPRAQGEAAFTSEAITVDAVRETAWDAATAYPVSRLFNGALTATAATGATGTVRYLWDGPVLYALVEVTGDTTAATANQTWTGASLASNASADGVVFGIDVFNDQWGMENDTTTWFFVNRSMVTYAMYGGTNIPSLSSFLYASNPDHSPRVKAVAGSAYSAASDSSSVNYTYEVAIDIEGWGDVWDYELANGVKVGMEIGIMDGSKTWAFWSKTNPTDAREGSSNLPNDERTRNRDWGEVALAGWDGEAPFAYSGFRADEAIRFWNSPNNPGAGGNYTGTGNGDNSEVWRADTKSSMIAAKAAYLAIKDDPDASREAKDAAVLAVCEAFAGLRWADETFPDPHDLPVEFTVPDPYKFFDPSKGTDGYVTTLAEWEERKAEILALAEFYEYGYKPQLGVDYTISITTNSYAGSGNASVVARVTPTNTGYWRGGAAQNITVAVTNPQLYNGQKVGLGFGVSGSGLAAVTNPTTWPFGDTRSDAVWGARSGMFKNLFPYERNRVGTDVSNAMAYATGVTVSLDILEAACAANAALAARIDVSKAATAGMSYLGKYAFVAAVYDERVAVAFPGAAGATGPANWRYNVQGQEYDFSGTIYSSNSAGAANVVAFGTEGPGNSYRHNRARETELFRHFMPYGHMYEHLEGAYNYGEYSRMPFDNALLLAAFVPDRMIVLDNCLNDFNDGAGTDNMSLQLARAMYRAMGADPDKYVKINSANYAPTGDPHGYSTGRVADAQIASDFLFGTSLVSAANNERLITDPFNLLIANGQTESAYDYYWGGFNTITGGTGGVDGRDGWYYVPAIVEIGAIEISPAAPTVARSSDMQFTAEVESKGGAPEGVVWSVAGNSSDDTAISEDGLLAVAADELARTLAVTAVSVFDGTKSATATVTIPNSGGILQDAVDTADAALSGTAQADYTAESYAGYAEARAAAETLLGGIEEAGVTQAQINGAASELLLAVAALRPDKTELAAAIGRAGAVVGDLYTIESYAEVVTAKVAAEAVSGSGEATVAQVKAAISGIGDAIAGLDEIVIEEGASTASLESVLATLSHVEFGVYKPGGVAALQDAIAQAQALLDTIRRVQSAQDELYAMQDIGQAEINSALQALIDALGALEIKDEYLEDDYLAALLGTLGQISLMDGAGYTPESWGDLLADTVLAWLKVTEIVARFEIGGTLEEAIADSGLSQIELGAKDAELKTKIANLESRQPETAPTATIYGGVYAGGNQALVAQYVDGAAAKFDFRVRDFNSVGTVQLKLSIRDNANIGFGDIDFTPAPGIKIDSEKIDGDGPAYAAGYTTYQLLILAENNQYISIGDDGLLFSVSAPLNEKISTVATAFVTDISIVYLDAGTGTESVTAIARATNPSDAAVISFRDRFDINNDGVVNLIDVDLVRRYLGAQLDGDVWVKPPDLSAALFDATQAERSNLNATVDPDTDEFVFVDGKVVFDDYEVDVADLTLVFAAYNANR